MMEHKQKQSYLYRIAHVSQHKYSKDRGCTLYTFLGYLGQFNTNRNIPIFIALPTVAKTSTAGTVVVLATLVLAT